MKRNIDIEELIEGITKQDLTPEEITFIIQNISKSYTALVVLVELFGWNVVEKLYQLAGEQTAIVLESKKLLRDKVVKACIILRHLWNWERPRTRDTVEKYFVRPVFNKTDLIEASVYLKLLRQNPDFFLSIIQDPDDRKVVEETLPLLDILLPKTAHRES